MIAANKKLMSHEHFGDCFTVYCLQLKGVVLPTNECSAIIYTLSSFQTCMTFFLLGDKEVIYS